MRREAEETKKGGGAEAGTEKEKGKEKNVAKGTEIEIVRGIVKEGIEKRIGTGSVIGTEIVTGTKRETVTETEIVVEMETIVKGDETSLPVTTEEKKSNQTLAKEKIVIDTKMNVRGVAARTGHRRRIENVQEIEARTGIKRSAKKEAEVERGLGKV